MAWLHRVAVLSLGLIAIPPVTRAQSAVQTSDHIKQALRSVAPDSIVESTLSGREVARHTVVLAASQSATIVVTHRDIDLTLRLSGGDDVGRPVVSTSDGPAGELRLRACATAEPLVLEMAAAHPSSGPGTYSVRLIDIGPTSDRDRRILDAQRHYSEAIRLRSREAYAPALDEAGEALKTYEADGDGFLGDAARSLLLLGQLADALARFGAAEAFYVRARGLVERESGGFQLLRARILDAYAANQIARGRFREAEPLVKEALATRQQLAGPSHISTAASLGTLADLYHESANVQEAAKTAERALEVASQSYDATDITLGDFINRVARSQLALGSYARAEQLYGETLQVRERIAGKESLAAAESLGGLARAALLAGDNAAAEERHLRTLSIRERILGPDHPLVANDVFNLGLISYRRRDFDTALARYERALAIREKTVGRSHPAIALTLNNIGLLYWQKLDYPRAEEFFSRALALAEQLYGADSLRVANALANLGIVAKETGNYALAETRYRRALAIKEHHLGSTHPELVAPVESLAILYRDRGDYAQAEKMFERTLALTTASFGAEHPFVARHLANMAQLYWALGDREKAFLARARVVAIEERKAALELSVGSEQQKLAYFEPLVRDLEQTIAFHVQQPEEFPAARDLAAITLLQRKGRVLDALADNLGAFRNRSSAEDRALLERLTRVTSDLAAAALSESTRLAAADRQQRVTTLTAEREGLEIELQKRSAGYLAASQPLTLAAVQAAVPPNAALIEFALYRPFDPSAGVEDDQQLGAARYVAYVVRQRGEVRWKDLGPAAPIDRAVDRFRSTLADPDRQDVTRRAAELHRLLMTPLEPLLDGAAHLLISPDGALNLIPFEALRNAGRYLVEDRLISYVTSGRDLVRMTTSRPVPGASVVVADPAFGEPGDDRRRSGQTPPPAARRVVSADGTSPAYFPRLAGTAREAKQILASFPEARLMTGDRASEGALKTLHAPRILHIATHGFFLEPGAPAPAGSRTTSSSRGIENPLLRSGLALAHANLQASAGDDGVLTALEAANLDLWGTKLVTLSACDTGIGLIRNGEGVFGLRRAFFLAGAETLVMSLWPISDLVARDMMGGYYAGLAGGLGRGAALHRVQLQMLGRKGRQHPFYWASFIQAGEWGNLEGRR